jgi:hypothetical protein
MKNEGTEQETTIECGNEFQNFTFQIEYSIPGGPVKMKMLLPKKEPRPGRFALPQASLAARRH